MKPKDIIYHIEKPDGWLGDWQIPILINGDELEALIEDAHYNGKGPKAVKLKEYLIKIREDKKNEKG